MTGIVWFVQVVHYPLFPNVGDAVFPGYQRRNVRLTTFVVAPLMLAELASSLGIAAWRQAGIPAWAAAAGLGLLAVIWLSTFLSLAPRHAAMARAFQADTHRGMLRLNWIRTVAWTLRAALVLWLAFSPRPTA